MEFEKISSPSLRELFVQQLEQMILSGKLPVGEKLPGTAAGPGNAGQPRCSKRRHF